MTAEEVSAEAEEVPVTARGTKQRYVIMKHALD